MQFVLAADADVTGRPERGIALCMSGRLLRVHRLGWNPYFALVCVLQDPVLCPRGLKITPKYRRGHVQTANDIVIFGMLDCLPWVI